MDKKTYIQALSDFVERETDTQIAQIKELWRQSVGERVAEGEAIANIEVVRAEFNRAWLHCSDNLSKFQRGDALLINRGDPFQGPRYACKLDRDSGTELIIKPGYRVNFSSLIPGRGWVLDRNTVDVRYLQLGALDQLGDGSQQSERVLSILQSRCRAMRDTSLSREARNVAERFNLNASQSAAFEATFSSQNFHLIQGPPGTGKTHVLAALAATLARRGKRVLITAFTHRAINNALRKTAQVTGYKNIAKIGQADRAEDLAWFGSGVPNYEYFESSPFASQNTGFIVGGTCFALRSKRLGGVHFDTVIFDEAGQMTLPLAAAGMLTGQRYVFFGDHKQMAPVIVAEHEQDWVTQSVFERLVQHAPSTMLDITYRMNSEINDYPSREFYAGRLQPSLVAQERRLHLNGTPGRFDTLLKPSPSSIFLAVNHRGRGMRAPEEADLAAQIVAEAVSRGLPPSEVAVVAPYRAQIRLIRSALLKLGIEPGSEGVVVDTVERIQGQERDLIVLSLTTSDPAHAAQRAAFYFQPNRLNVAITRARVKRIVIGSPHLFTARPTDPEHQKWVAHFRGLYEDSHVYSMNPESSGA